VIMQVLRTEYHRSWRKKNLDRVKAVQREWYLKNAEKIAAKNKIHRENNAEKINASKRAWYLKESSSVIEKNNAYKKNNPEKHDAHMAVSRAIKAGKLKRQCCFECGKEKTEGHHQDYSKPLEVIWLCSYHHKALHRKQKKAA